MDLVKFRKLDPAATLPRYQTLGAAGFDFHSLGPVAIYPGVVTPVRTGLAVQLPPGTVLFVTPRSGYSIKHPTYISNAPGVVDEDYRGEIKILTVAWDKPIHIAAGERFAQGVILPYVRAMILEVTQLEETERGTGGFGSTDK
jgi:dUTP pyrophosphatase